MIGTSSDELNGGWMEEKQQMDQLIVMQTQNTRENSEKHVKDDQQEDGEQMEDETEFKTRWRDGEAETTAQNWAGEGNQ